MILLFTVLSFMIAGFSGCPKKVVDTGCGAENHFYTTDGRLFVSGVMRKSSIFEVVSPARSQFKLIALFDAKLEGDNKTLVHLFHGIVEYDGYLLVLCNKSTFDEVCLLNKLDFADITEPYLFYAKLDEIRIGADGKPVKGLFKQVKINLDNCVRPLSYANGMAIDSYGNIFIADSMGSDPKIVAIKLGNLKDEDTSNDLSGYKVLWEGHANGMAIEGNHLYFSNQNKSQYTAYNLELFYGQNGDVETGDLAITFQGPDLIDDLSIFHHPDQDSKNGLFVTNFDKGYVFYVGFDNDYKINDKVIELTGAGTFSSPSSVKLAASPMFGKWDVTVTELGILGFSNMIGNKLSYFNAEDKFME
jgi:hypothetical protein